MRSRDEVLLRFGFPLFTEKDIDAAIYSMADRIRELEQEHHEDQGVITVLRGRIERQDTRISKLKRERDEARRDRDAVQQRHDANVAGIIEAVCDLIAAEVVPKGSRSLGDAVKGATSAIAALRHRAERAERVVEAAKEYVIAAPHEVAHYSDNAMDAYDDLRIAVRALDAEEGTP